VATGWSVCVVCTNSLYRGTGRSPVAMTIFTEGSSWHGFEFFSLRMPATSSLIWASSQSTTITPWAGTSAQMCLINLDKEISLPYSFILVSMHYWVGSGVHHHGGLRRHVP
jgi:hypothetical protein